MCPLTVPKYRVFKSGAGQEQEDAYLKQLGYRITTDEDTGQVLAAPSCKLGRSVTLPALGRGAAWRLLLGGNRPARQSSRWAAWDWAELRGLQLIMHP